MKRFFCFLAALFIAFAATPAKALDVITLNPSNTLSLRTQVNEESATHLIHLLESAQVKTIYIYINSPGGSLLSGFKIINAIRNSGKHVVCIADYAASMAFSIFQSCNERYVVEGAIIMQHQASMQVDGKLSEIEGELAFVHKLAKKLNEWDARRIGLSLKDFQDKIEHDWWMFDSEAVEQRAADKQIGVRCTSDLAQAIDTTTMMSMFGPVTLTWSACPLVSTPIGITAPSMTIGGKKMSTDDVFNAVKNSLDWKGHREVR